jgi:hypothetical protein
MHRYIVSLSLFLFCYQSFYAQGQKKPYDAYTFVSIGYLNADLDDVRKIYDDILAYYQFSNIPIVKQSDFGKTLAFNVGIVSGRTNTLNIGAVFTYAYSPAYAGYKDDAGTLIIKGNVKSYQYSLLFNIPILKKEYFTLSVELKPSVAYSRLSMTDEMTYREYPHYNNSYALEAHGWVPCGDALCNLTIPISYFLFSFEIGYRYLNLPEAEGSVTITPKEMPIRHQSYFSDRQSGPSVLKYNINQSGTIYLVSVGLEL